MGTLHDDQYTFLIISCSCLLRMKNVQTKFQIKSKHILCSITYCTENRAIYEIMWKKIVDPNRYQRTIGCMVIACYISKATDTHSKYIILIAIPVQHLLQEYSSVSHCMLPVL